MIRRQPADSIFIERSRNYVLSDEDRDVITAFEFRMTDNLWVLSTAIQWLTEAPNTQKLINNIINFDRYFRTRRQAILETLPRLQASKNQDMRNLWNPLKEMAEKLDELTTALASYPTAPSPGTAAALQAKCRAICGSIQLLGESVKNNPAYDAYILYIDQHKLEANRVTVDFELQYSDEAAK